MFKSIKEMFFPQGIKCIICDCDLPTSPLDSVCDKCRTKLPFNRDYCKKCGRYYLDSYDTCYDCKKTDWKFNSARSVFLFEGEIKNLIYNLKFDNGRYLAKYCAEFLFQLYESDAFEIDFITFVPMHKKRQKRRGYNQGELLAVEFGKILNVPVADLLVKCKHTKNMSRLNKEERKKHIKDSFAINPDWQVKMDAKISPLSESISALGLHGRNIMIVDDLFTTGATSNECSSVLKDAGCNNIYIITIASQVFKKSKDKKSKRKNLNDFV